MLHSRRPVTPCACLPQTLKWLIAFLFLVAATADTAMAQTEAYFEFSDSAGTRPDTFVIRLTDPVQIQAARDVVGRIYHALVSGIIVTQSAPYNLPWGFYLDPGTITFPEATIEACETPISYVQQHLSEVGGGFLPGNRWCPDAYGLKEITAPTAALRFVPVNPCRIADTRGANGPVSGPYLPAGTSRDFPVTGGNCGIPPSAQAYALNITAVPRGSLPYITVWPAGQGQPLVSTLNSFDGRIKANAAIVAAGTAGAISIYAAGATDVVLDISGYFVSASPASGLAFYPLPPCRVLDTRLPSVTLGGPPLTGGERRTISMAGTPCGAPLTAAAYSLNVTAVPKRTLGYLTLWPSGQPQPLVSTLNAPTGTVTANAAIVPAGAGTGSIEVFATDDTDLILDLNGYFAPAGGAGALAFYTAPPCRVYDNRLYDDPVTHINPIPPLTGSRDIPVSAKCAMDVAGTVFSLNVTVVPQQALAWLTMWQPGAPMPVVSVLNALDGAVTSNASLVAAPQGQVSIYVAGTAEIILDLNGFFAPEML